MKRINLWNHFLYFIDRLWRIIELSCVVLPMSGELFTAINSNWNARNNELPENSNYILRMLMKEIEMNLLLINEYDLLGDQVGFYGNGNFSQLVGIISLRSIFKWSSLVIIRFNILMFVVGKERESGKRIVMKRQYFLELSLWYLPRIKDASNGN